MFYVLLNIYIFFRYIKVGNENVDSTVNHKNKYCSMALIFSLLEDYPTGFSLNKIN